MRVRTTATSILQYSFRKSYRITVFQTIRYQFYYYERSKSRLKKIQFAKRAGNVA
nr:MAG TPA: hypothetical protein [Caudoviricetes sp.]